MSALRPNANASFATERLFGLGAGLFIASAILSKDSKSAVVGLVGAVLVIATTIASIIIRRKQLAISSQENAKNVK